MSAAACKDQDLHFLHGTFEKYHDHHAVEGFDVTFSYNCHGTIVAEQWVVDSYPISYHQPPYYYDYKKEVSSKHCINTLTLILYNVKVNYTNKYTVFPSRNKIYDNSGIRAAAHLSEYKYILHAVIVLQGMCKLKS